MNKMKKKLAAAGLCFVLSAGMLTGCGNSGKAIATLDGEKTEYAVANILLRYNQAQMQSYYGAYMGDTMWDQYGETTKTNVMSTLKQMLILEKHMDDYNVTLTDEEKQKISDTAAAFIADNDKKTLKAMGATQERMERVITLYTIQAKVYNAIIADVDTEVSDEEAAQKTIQYVLFSTADTTDSDGNTVALSDDQKAALLDQAEQLQEAVAGGTDMAEALSAIDEDKSVSTASYGDNDEEYSLDEAIRTEADKLQDGEVAEDVIETDSGYYVVQMKATFDESATEQKKQSIVSQRKSDKFSEVYDAWEAEADYTEDTDLLGEMTFTDTYELATEATEAQSETESAAAAQSETESAAAAEEGSEAETVTEVSETSAE